MKLINLIEDAKQPEHRQELSEAKFLELLNGKAKNAHYIAKKNPFFRQDSGADMMLVTPEMKEERSKFWVDKLIKEIPAWGKMPSRSRFIKGYTNYDRTFGGDDVYVMIPLDGTKIGIAPGPSFYRSFKYIEKSLGFDRVDNKTFISWLETVQEGLAQLTDTKIKKHEPETFSQFRKALEQIDKVLKDDRKILEKNLSTGESLSTEQAAILKDLLARHVVSTERYLEEKLDPEGNGFHAVRIESFTKGTGDHEIWIDKPCLLIKRSTYIEMNKRGSL
jgi:hypothetical protein